MAHLRTHKGGRRWYGKRQAKEDGRVTRRQDDAESTFDLICGACKHPLDDHVEGKCEVCDAPTCWSPMTLVPRQNVLYCTTSVMAITLASDIFEGAAEAVDQEPGGD